MVMVTARGTEPDRAAAESGCGGASIPGERCLGFARTYFNSHRRPPLKPLAKETTHNFRDRRGGVPQSLVPSAGVSSQLDPPLVESPEDDVHVGQIGGEGLEDGHERTVAADLADVDVVFWALNERGVELARDARGRYEGLRDSTSSVAEVVGCLLGQGFQWGVLSLIHISEPTRRTPISYAVF